MKEESTQLNLIKNNAKLIGGVLGAEEQYLSNIQK